MNKIVERLQNGIIKENPTFVLMLGMCPTLAVTTSAMNGLGMGLSTTVVLVMSNLLISLLGLSNKNCFSSSILLTTIVTTPHILLSNLLRIALFELESKALYQI